jgi:uncharacterized membrane protein HdeD (DUF308 family)
MHKQERIKNPIIRNPRSSALILDIVHIAVGILIVVLAIISFLNPEENMFLFPIIFFLAAALNLINGIHKIRVGGRDKKRKISGIVTLLFAILLAALTVVSAISIWWG